MMDAQGYLGISPPGVNEGEWHDIDANSHERKYLLRGRLLGMWGG